MKSWFGERPSWWGPKTVPAHVDGTAGSEAYDEGRADERQRVERQAAPDRGEIKDAYQRGRQDERRRRRGSPLLGFLLLIVVVAGAALVLLAVQNGSFRSGGAVVDNSLSQVSQTAQAPIRNAADKAGEALENAGQNLKQTAGNQAGDQ